MHDQHPPECVEVGADFLVRLHGFIDVLLSRLGKGGSGHRSSLSSSTLYYALGYLSKHQMGLFGLVLGATFDAPERNPLLL